MERKIEQFIFMIWLKNKAERLVHIMPDWLTGNSGVMYKKYRKKYELKDCNLLIKQQKIRIMTIYLLIIIIFMTSILSLSIFQLMRSEEITMIKRPGYEEQNITVPLQVQVNYKGYALTKKVDFRIQKKLLSDKEKRKLLQIFGDELDQLILGGNKDIGHITRNLNLIDRDPNTGITIKWTNDHPNIINEDGEVDLLNAKNKQRIVLQAQLTIENTTISKKIPLSIDRNASEDDYVQNMERNLYQIIDKISASSHSEYVRLPKKLINGMEIRWFTEKSDSGMLVLLFVIALLIVYMKRYDQINKEIKESEESILKDLPEFMNKIVLLLNAGLVVSTAISKVVEDYESFYCGDQIIKNISGKKYLYEELSKIQKRVNQSNNSLIKELKEFSQRSGVRELVRITAVISDNWDKGSTMVEKLEGESELLWISRKKKAEERGRLAETKLTFPLMVLLIVLIMVTISPALMGM